MLTGILLGIGIAGFVDESVFHRLSHWHAFYDATSPDVRLVSGGAFHVLSTPLLIVGALRLWRENESHDSWRRRTLLAGVLVGAGGFKTYDGVVQVRFCTFISWTGTSARIRCRTICSVPRRARVLRLRTRCVCTQVAQRGVPDERAV